MLHFDKTLCREGSVSLDLSVSGDKHFILWGQVRKAREAALQQQDEEALAAGVLVRSKRGGKPASLSCK